MAPQVLHVQALQLLLLLLLLLAELLGRRAAGAAGAGLALGLSLSLAARGSGSLLSGRSLLVALLAHNLRSKQRKEHKKQAPKGHGAP